ncbi:MAG: hypothetical protein ACK52I_29645 [Pseudomonadota bacterium]
MTSMSKYCRIRKARRLEPPSFSNSNSIGATIRAKYIVINGIRIARDFEPETFGRLTTIGPRFSVSDAKNNRRILQVAQCQCGNVDVFIAHLLRIGNTSSCGCLQKDRASQSNTTHGNTGTDEYAIHKGMLSRCYNKNRKITYDNYGGRGIKVCDRWLEPDGRGFMNFLEDMGPRPSTKHSIDRIDVNGDYCPENCRWASQLEQGRNKRNSKYMIAFGKTQCQSAWAEEFGIGLHTLRARLRKGLSPEEALTRPVQPQKRKKRENT